MNKKIKIGLIGGGNIMATRHLPALMPFLEKVEIIGILDPTLEKAQKLAQKFNIKYYSSYKKHSDLSKIDWFKEIDAVIIATPPHEHYPMVDKCLSLKKHVLVEKPFVTNIKDGLKPIAKAKKLKKVLLVNHNFQFAGSFKKLDDLVKNKTLGDISSLFLYQISNDTRRLPKWGDNLPLGLFYDESPHFFYLIRKFTGEKLRIKNVFKVPSKKNKNTPKILTANLESNNIPITMSLNFEGPVCEWYFCVIGSSKIAIADLFRDILIVLPNDGQHLWLEVLKTSIFYTFQHWLGFVLNGWKYSRNQLFYGVDDCHKVFFDSIKGSKKTFGMSADDGLWVNKMQQAIVKKAS